MAQPDHGYPALYLLAAEASTLGVALAPESPDFLAVKALAFARIGCGTFALDCLAQEELATGSTNAIGWAARAMVMLDALDAEQAELALGEATRLALEDQLAVPTTGMDDLLKELQQRLLALQHGNGGAATQEGLNGPPPPPRQAPEPEPPLSFSAQPLSSNASQQAPSPWPAAQRIQGNPKGPQSTPRM